MPLYLIERRFAGLVDDDPEAMGRITLVNDEIGIRWLYSFLSADRRKTYCLYEAPSPEAILAAAQRLDIPADEIVEVNETGPFANALADLREQKDELGL